MGDDDLETCWAVCLGLYRTQDTTVEVDRHFTDFKQCLAELWMSNATVVGLYVTADSTAMYVSVPDYAKTTAFKSLGAENLPRIFLRRGRPSTDGASRGHRHECSVWYILE